MGPGEGQFCLPVRRRRLACGPETGGPVPVPREWRTSTSRTVIPYEFGPSSLDRYRSRLSLRSTLVVQAREDASRTITQMATSSHVAIMRTMLQPRLRFLYLPEGFTP